MREDWLTRRKHRMIKYIVLAHLTGLLICAVVLAGLGQNSYLTGTIAPVAWLGLTGCLLLVFWAATAYLHKDLLPGLGPVNSDLAAYALLAAIFILVLLLPGDNSYLKPLLLVPVIVTATARGRLLGTLTAFVAGGSLILSSMFLAPHGSGLNQVLETDLIFTSLALLIGWFVGGLSQIEIGAEAVIAEAENRGRSEQDPGISNRLGAFNARLQREMAEHREAKAILQAQQHICQVMLGVMEKTAASLVQGHQTGLTVSDVRGQCPPGYPLQRVGWARSAVKKQNQNSEIKEDILTYDFRHPTSKIAGTRASSRAQCNAKQIATGLTPVLGYHYNFASVECWANSTPAHREICTLSDLTTSLQQAGCEEMVAERVLQVVCNITGAAAGLYFRYDESGVSVSMGGVAGMVRGLTSEVCRNLQEIIEQRWELLAGRGAAPSRSPLYLPDLPAEPGWEACKTADARSCYIVPLYYGERLFGLYALLSNIAGGFSRERQTLADTLASFISTALENARLFGDAQRACERLKEIQQQLLHAQKLEAVGQLAAGVAHELNNQLSVIQACTDLYCNKPDRDNTVYRSFLKIGKAAKMSANLARQLLMLGRRAPQHKTVLSLNDSMMELSDTLSDVLSSHQVALNLELEDGLLLVDADADSVDQLVVNLVINARDVMPQGGVITIKTRNLVLEDSGVDRTGASRGGRFVLLSVADTGTGMDEQTRSRIFEPFFTTKELGKGTGLGLAVVYSIVKNHDGWIDVRSQPGQGSCFEIYLPVTDAGGRKSDA